MGPMDVEDSKLRIFFFDAKRESRELLGEEGQGARTGGHSCGADACELSLAQDLAEGVGADGFVQAALAFWDLTTARPAR